MSALHIEHTRKITDHEERITRLEKWRGETDRALEHLAERIRIQKEHIQSHKG